MFSVEQFDAGRVGLLVVLAGAAGAGCRYLAGVMLYDPSSVSFPWSTWWCNVLGAFLLALLRQRGLTDPMMRSRWSGPVVQRIAGTGFLGAFTTFSAIGLETVTLVGQGHEMMATIYVISGWLAGWLAVLAGDRLIRRRSGREG